MDKDTLTVRNIVSGNLCSIVWCDELQTNLGIIANSSGSVWSGYNIYKLSDDFVVPENLDMDDISQYGSYLGGADLPFYKDGVKKYNLKFREYNDFQDFMLNICIACCNDKILNFEKGLLPTQQIRDIIMIEVNRFLYKHQWINLQWHSKNLFMCIVEHFVRTTFKMKTTKWVKDILPLIDFIQTRSSSNFYQMIKSYSKENMNKVFDYLDIVHLKESIIELKLSSAFWIDPIKYRKEVIPDDMVYMILYMSIRNFIKDVLLIDDYIEWRTFTSPRSIFIKTEGFRGKISKYRGNEDLRVVIKNIIDKIKENISKETIKRPYHIKECVEFTLTDEQDNYCSVDFSLPFRIQGSDIGIFMEGIEFIADFTIHLDENYRSKDDFFGCNCVMVSLKLTYEYIDKPQENTDN